MGASLRDGRCHCWQTPATRCERLDLTGKAKTLLWMIFFFAEAPTGVTLTTSSSERGPSPQTCALRGSCRTLLTYGKTCGAPSRAQTRPGQGMVAACPRQRRCIQGACRLLDGSTSPTFFDTVWSGASIRPPARHLTACLRALFCMPATRAVLPAHCFPALAAACLLGITCLLICLPARLYSTLAVCWPP